jgi:dsDNA-binding SOS-regulon protein
MKLIQKIKDLFFKPDVSDQERVDRWHKEVDQADRLKTLHRESRKQTNKQKNKTLSSNF